MPIAQEVFMKRRFNIGSRLILSVSAILVVVIAAIAVSIFLSYSSSLDGQLKSSSNATTELIREEIKGWLAPKDRTVVALGIEAREVFPDAAALRRFYSGYVKSDPDFSDVYFFESKSFTKGGKVITASGWIPPADYDQFTRSWFTGAMATDAVILTEPYLDAITGKLVVTVAQRLADADGKIMGVVGGDMFITRVGEIVASTRKISANGVTFLLDMSGRYLTNDDLEKILKASPFDDPRVAPYKASVLAQDSTFTINRGSGLYLASQHIPEMNAVVVTFGPLNDIYGALYRFLGLLALIAGLGIVVAVLLIALISRSITGPLVAVVGKVKLVAQGELELEIEKSYQERGDEIGDLAVSMATLVSSFREIITSVQTAAKNVAISSGEMSASAEKMSQGATEQASSMEEVSSSMEEMASNIKQNTDNALQTDSIAQKASSGAESGGARVADAVAAVKEIASRIVIIEEIARQTNLLALNAAIEAARAGEAGKGFAVVASEVRKLAERSQTAAGEINGISQRTVSSAEDASLIINNLVPDIKKTAQLVQEIAAASREQNQGADQINSALLQLDSVVQQSASMSEELSATAEELSSQAEALKDAVSYFKIGQLDQGAVASGPSARRAAPAARKADEAPRSLPAGQPVTRKPPVRDAGAHKTSIRPVGPGQKGGATGQASPPADDSDFEEF